MNNYSHLQALYSGFCNTPLLWEGPVVRGLKQLQIKDYNPLFLRNVERRLRLGQLAERFVFNQLDGHSDFKILAENIQIQDEKRTVGELDALLMKQLEALHIEMVYKFYLYDESLGDSETEKWIEPNRRDSLVEKLDKLQNKQLPLLYSKHCEPVLEALHLKAKDIQQQVLFKAQLFIPYQTEVTFETLNPHCVTGFYIHLNQLQQFSDSKFYIPAKIDWFLEPHTFVDWLSFDEFSKASHSFLEQRKAPLFWMKKENGELLKGFLVWW